MGATKEYHKLLQYILDNGTKKGDRTGTGTKSIFDYKIKFDMQEGFPLITTKRLHTKSIIHELLWFLKGSTNTKYLQENGVTIWDEWAKEDGSLGPIYGKQWVNWGGIKKTPHKGWLHKRDGVWCVKWSDLHSFSEGTHWSYTDISTYNQRGIYTDNDEGREVNFYLTTLGHNPETFTPNTVATITDNHTHSGGVNQIQNAIDTLKNNPDSRRIMVSAWNVGEIDQMALPPCHWAFELYTEELTLDEKCDWLIKHKDYDSLIKGNVHHDHVSELVNDEAPKRRLSLKWHQRSVDTFLGLPFNIASYALLLEMFAQQTNMVPGTLVGDLTNVHIYDNHIEYVKEQLDRAYSRYESPTLRLNHYRNVAEGTPAESVSATYVKKNMFEYKFKDFDIENYQYFPNWKNVPIAV